MRSPTTKDMAEYFRLALGAGICREYEIKRWSDAMIANSPSPIAANLKFLGNPFGKSSRFNKGESFGCLVPAQTPCPVVIGAVALAATTHSFPEFQSISIATGVEDRKNIDLVGFDAEMNDTGETAGKDQAPDVSPNGAKQLRIISNLSKVMFYNRAKSLAQAVAVSLISLNRLFKFCRRPATEPRPALHLPFLVSSRAFTDAKETRSSGWPRWSWSRASINSVSPRASASSNFARSCSNTPHCSATGSFSNRFMTSPALMGLPCRLNHVLPAAFFSGLPCLQRRARPVSFCFTPYSALARP